MMVNARLEESPKTDGAGEIETEEQIATAMAKLLDANKRHNGRLNYKQWLSGDR